MKSGVEVRCFIQYTFDGSEGWLSELSQDVRKNIEVFPGDVRDSDRVLGAVQGCHQVFHLASLIGIPYSYKAVESYLSTNVNGTLNVLKAALNSSVEKVVHTSTSEVYGSAQYVPIDERHPLRAQSPYAASKIAADQLVESFWRSFELPAVTIRPFNTFGPRQSSRAVIPAIISQAVSSDSGKIFIGDLTTKRDLTFVSDTVEGFILGATKESALGETINLGTGAEVEISKIIELVGNVLGKNLVPTRDESRMRPKESEVTRLLSDNSKARNLLDWEPKYGGLEGFKKGLSETIAWWQDRGLPVANNGEKFIY